MKRALFPALVLISSVPLPAAELLSPGEVIATVEKAGQKRGDDVQNSAAALAAKLEAFSATAASLSPQEAAKGWLKLFLEDWRKLSPTERQRFPDPRASGFSSLVRALPPPAAWKALKAEIAATRTGDVLLDQLLALFAATLNNDTASQFKAFTAITKLSKDDVAGSPSLEAIGSYSPEFATRYVDSLIQQLALPLAKFSDDPAEIRQLLEVQLKAMAVPQQGYRATLNLPSVAALGGEQPAKEFIEKGLASGVVLRSSDPNLLALARNIVLSDPSKLKAPQWNLIDGISEDDVRLYQLLEKKYPQTEENRFERRQAGELYFLASIVAGKSDAARAWIESLKDRKEVRLNNDALQLVLSQGKGYIVLDFLFETLAKDPYIPLWSDLIELAAREGRSGEALELARTIAKEKKLKGDDRKQLISLLVAAALADGKVDEAVGLMREQMSASHRTGPRASDAITTAESLATLGQLLKRDDLRDEGIREAIALASTPSDFSPISSAFLDLLVKTGRASDAQNLVITAMSPQLARGAEYSSSIDLTENLTNLAGLYDQAGRPNDVLKILAEAPWWRSKDLSGIVQERDFRGITLGEMAARSFVANKNKEKAVEILKATLRSVQDDDSSYQMLIDLEGQNAIPFLDEQFADDRFQERPLIWKAILQLQAGQTTEAEKIIRQAIAIDPSDGEMGPDDRMRAYAVLADILEKTGKEADAKVYRGAVQAVRLAEQADKYVSAGLLSQAIAMYEEALNYFADAYCIQSRLAVHLATQGKTKEAEAHYIRAYELMPDSFGRMESHCFGCERAFKGPMAETLSEKTFSRLIAENPGKPQLYYLMGYLRMEQKKSKEALSYFQKAVELDPDYINAWRKILSLDGSILLPNAVRNKAALEIVRLQPESSSSTLREVTSLEAIWTLTEQLLREHPPTKPKDLLPLEGTANKMERERNRRPEDSFYAHQFSSSDNEPASPGAAVASQELMQSISQIFDQLSQIQR